jgi:hypothetical protein
MRDILHDLYRARRMLRRKGVPRKGAPNTPLHISKAASRR